MTDQGITFISKLPKLRILELPEFASITDTGIKIFAKNAYQIQRLRLANLDISDGSLTELSHCTSLRELIISYCPLITDVGLLKLVHITELKCLEINQCMGITPSGLKQFQMVLPLCQVTSNS